MKHHRPLWKRLSKTMIIVSRGELIKNKNTGLWELWRKKTTVGELWVYVLTNEFNTLSEARASIMAEGGPA